MSNPWNPEDLRRALGLITAFAHNDLGSIADVATEMAHDQSNSSVAALAYLAMRFARDAARAMVVDVTPEQRALVTDEQLLPVIDAFLAAWGVEIAAQLEQ